MALDALWAVSIPEVSGVSEVQTPIHAGLRDTPAVLPEVSRVSSNDSGGTVTAMPLGADTPDTLTEKRRYQAQPAWALGCTLDTPDIPEKINTEANAANEPLTGELLTTEPIEPKRLFRARVPWLTDTEQAAARAYHAHHLNCPTCISAGRGNRYGQRCGAGMALWQAYSAA
jgi:hypothetical protein